MPAAPSRLDEFMGKMLGDMGAAFSAALVVVGDRLGLLKALAQGGPMTPGDLAKRTGTTERPVGGRRRRPSTSCWKRGPELIRRRRRRRTR